MNTLWIILIVIAVLAALFFLATYICFRLAFYADRKKSVPKGEYDLPPGEIYEPFYPLMRNWIKEIRSLPGEDVYITSFDGLKLHGRYYEYAPGAPVELQLHGYRGSAERDLCGGVQRCFALGRSALIVDQRTSGKSEGSIISFGINESRDCRAWIDFMIDHFGPDVKIILTGISMGAATVMITAGQPLPKNVIGALADCGYTSAKEIIKIVIGQMKLPPRPLYPLVKLAARLYGHFDLEEFSPIEAMKTCTVPMIFIHGEADDFVPCEMSRENYAACCAPKAILTVPGAGHGLSYPVDQEGYLNALRDFSAQMEGKDAQKC